LLRGVWAILLRGVWAVQLPYWDLALAMLQMGTEDLYLNKEVAVDCTAPPTAIHPDKDAFLQQKEILFDNIWRKVVPPLFAGCTLGAAGLGAAALVLAGKGPGMG
jgi:hypothetical protein